MAEKTVLPQKLVETLAPYVTNARFDELLTKLTPKKDKSERFLIKMELRRLAKPCQRIIDLRGILPNDCHAVTQGDITHYLDEESQQELERQLAIYKSYTFGVYEHINRLARQRAEQNKTGDASVTPTKHEQNVVAYYEYGRFHQRQEERMNFSVAVVLKLSDTQNVNAASVDISMTGLQLKLKDDVVVEKGQRVLVVFKELEDEFIMPTKVEYEVLVVKLKNNHKYVSLKRTPHDPDTDEFSQFLRSFIRGNKKRYKINLDNTLYAIMSRGLEQYYVSSQPTLPVFISAKQKGHKPVFALLNEINDELFHYFQDSGVNRIAYLCTESRLARWTSEDNDFEDRLYLFYVERDSKRFYYSALESELQQHDNVRHAFIGYGAQQASWRVIKVNVVHTRPEQGHRATTLPDELSESIAKANRPPSAKIQSLLGHMPYMLLLTDVTCRAEDYQAFAFERGQLAELNRFAHKRQLPSAHITPISFRNHSVRHEPRYHIHTQVQVKNHEGKWVKGKTVDVSCTGMKIQLVKPISQLKAVEVSLPDLQESHPEFPLQNIGYEIRHHKQDHHVLCLRVLDNDHGRQTQRAMAEILSGNQARSKIDQEAQDGLSLGVAMKNILLHEQDKASIFLLRQGARYVPSCAGSHDPQHRFWQCLSSHKGHIDLNPLLTGKHGQLLQQHLKQLRPQGEYSVIELLASVSSQGKAEFAYVEQFDDVQKAQQFVHQADNKGTFVGFKLYLCRTSRPELSVVDKEMRYVSHYMMYKAREVEDKLWAINATITVLDDTDEIRQRLMLEPTT